MSLKMILFTILCCLWSSSFVFAPPSVNINHNRLLENGISNISNTKTKVFLQRRKMPTNRTKTAIDYHQFDINSYRSSWKFIDKTTIRVRFRLHETLLSSIVSARFLVRHMYSGSIQTRNEPDEIVNSTLTIYLQNLKHGRHTVCVLIYTSQLMKNPKFTFCQDIVYNFHKYRHHDMDSDEHTNTFVFLITQYTIVLGILCMLQIVHAARKRRFVRAVCHKANALRNLMTEYHHRPPDTKPSAGLHHPPHALEQLIYNLNRNVLRNFDQVSLQTTTEEDTSPKLNRQKIQCEKNLKLPDQKHASSITPLLRNRRPTQKTHFDLEIEQISDDSDFDARSYEEKSISLKSVSHILEANKPWMTRLNKNGTIKHDLLPCEPLQNTRVHHI